MSKQDWLYGIHSVSAILERHPDRVLELFIVETREDKRIGDIIKLAKTHGLRAQFIPKKTMDHQLEEGAVHQGVAIRYRPSAPGDENDLKHLVENANAPLFLLFLDGITDPHNLGACLRSADAAGVHAVITTRDKSAGLSAAVRKVAVGAAETVPFIQVTNLARTLEMVRQQGVWVYGTALSEGAKTIYETDLRGNIGIVMGAEGVGLRRLTQDCCDGLVYIPMAGTVQSLNVSVATGVCLFEALRQRS
ncbi:23s rrna (guanosine-2\'-o-)-methyltransferase [gamma proteobacterium HdN1]|nr:23s rrna (guanosine-2\'-o-)-methyltransferase [gamma proteobacterium HdN1]